MRSHLILLALLPLAGGCVVAAVGAAVAYGVIKVQNNKAYRDYRADLETTWQATKDELEARGYKFDYNAEYNAYDGRIQAADATVEVGVGYEDTTRVSVTIGTFETSANIEAAKRILRGIAKRLGESEQVLSGIPVPKLVAPDGKVASDADSPAEIEKILAETLGA